MAYDDFDAVFGVPGLSEGADHVDVHTVEGRGELRDFLVGVLNYRPCWLNVLWSLRSKLLKVLGQGGQFHGQESQAHGQSGRLTAETFPMKPGENALFFTVTESDGETCWVAEGRDRHLDVFIAVAAEPVEGKPGQKRFSVGTVVFYNNWAGPVYFNLIRPFHHLVVAWSMRAALRP